MSVIEFSGLVTGLDTNSWVSALTALKNAKVEELQTEKAAVVELKDVVSGIKTFFTSFRSSLERLTDAKLGVDAMDILFKTLQILLTRQRLRLLHQEILMKLV